MRTLVIFSALLLFVVVACTQQPAKETDQETTIAEPSVADSEPGIPSLSADEVIYYQTEGEKIATQAMQALGKELMSALNDSGVVGAIQYCNVKALPLTDSISQATGTTIRRTTLQYRNISNQPDSLENAILNAYTQKQKNGDPLEPMTLRTANGDVLYAAPIMVNMLCLKCHGTVGEDVQPENYAQIKELYPYDKAIAYKAGDLRGIWSIRFTNP